MTQAATETSSDSATATLDNPDRDPIAELAAAANDGLNAYQTVVRLYEPELLLASLHRAVTNRELKQRTRTLAEVLAVAYEFDAELPWRLRSTSADQRSVDELFSLLEGTGELEPAFIAAMIHA